MYSSFLRRLIFLRGPLFHAHSIAEALFYVRFSSGVYILAQGDLPHIRPHYFKVLAGSPRGTAGSLAILFYFILVFIMGSISLPLLMEISSWSI